MTTRFPWPSPAPLATLALLVLGCAVCTPAVRGQETRAPIPIEVAIDQPGRMVPRLPEFGIIPGASARLFSITRAEAEGQQDRVDAFDPGTKAREVLFDAATLNNALQAAGATVDDPARVPPFTFVDANTVRVVAGGTIYRWALGTARAETRLRLPADASVEAIAPGDVAVAAIVDHDLIVRDEDGDTRRVTFDGRPQDIVYGGAAHRAEFGITDGLWWDASGRHLAFSREDMRPIDVYPYADYRTLPARPEHGRYPMAGRSHSRVQIGVFDRETKRLVYLENDADADIYWTNVTFSPDGQHVYVALVDRAQSNMELCRFDAHTGTREHVLLRESSAQWIEPEHGPIFLPDGSAFLWFSSRDGYRHLSRHALDGTLLHQETSGAFDVRSFVRFGPGADTAWVMAGGDDPCQQHLFRVRLGAPTPIVSLEADPRPKMSPVTSYGPGFHDCDVADDGTILDAWSSLDRPGYLFVHLPDGTRELLAQAEDPLAPFLIGNQQRFTVEAEDGTPLHGHVLLPPRPTRRSRHPVLLYVYGGPHAQLVQERWQGGASPWLQFMASQGYVVVRLDGRGTPHRGRAFEQAIHRHLGEIEVLDQVRALEWVRENVPYADLDRTGVHGWSYGGYMTLRLMLLEPDRFVCGVSGAPVTDWARYETGYGERYMDTPSENPDGYEASSVLPLAERLTGKLLLVHGTDDKTVMFSHSMAFLRAAIDAGKDLDFMAYPMALHGLRGTDRAHFQRKMTAFFAANLPVSPRSAGGR
ncbi:MAG: prolyl oligopeptidase family serine peptidase [Planctomycetota bacterium]